MNAGTALRSTEIPQFNPIVAVKPRLLIVSDSADRLAVLKASFDRSEIEVLSATSSEEVSRASSSQHDLAVIDVSPTNLIGVLKTLRSSVEHSEIPLLVEAGRLSRIPDLAGVLPKYRAMPCSQADLIALALRRITPGSSRRREKKML